MITTVAGLEAWLRTLPVWQSVGLLLVVSLLASRFVAVFGIAAVRQVVRRTETRYDDIVFEELRLPVTVSVALAGLYVAGSWLDLSSTLATGQGMTEFYLRAGTLSVLAVFWARALMRIGDRIIEVDDGKGTKSDFLPIFENLWDFGLIVGTLGVLLALWKVDVTPLLASAGIAGIAVGFAAKDTVANFFGSIALYVDDTYRVGDYVVLDSGEAGTVLDISIRSTRLLTRDNVVVTVPNSVLNSARIVNQSAPVQKKRIKVPIGVAYGTDLETVEETLRQVAAAEDLVLDTPHPRPRFRRFGDSALEYELLAWVGHPMSEGRAVHNLNRAIYRAFDAANVEIPYPQRELTIRDGERREADAPGDGEHLSV
ncbi:mechanosensitive ion channel family protein [Halobacteriaceae archaeon GCM10025711]